MFFDKIAILGVGLLGGSFALGMKSRSLCGHVTGFGRNTESLKAAVSTGAIDSYETDPARACIDAELVVLATPAGGFAELVQRIKGALKPGALLIDLGSVKGALVSEIDAIMPEGVHYVPCHPIAGSDRSGIMNARPDLFDGALCIMTKTSQTDASAFNLAMEMWISLGMTVRELDPFEHDRIYGLVSHLPHVAAYALINAIGSVQPESLDFGGQGLRDTTRIAMSAPALWTDICMMNRENLIEFIGVLTRELDGMRDALRAGDKDALSAAYERARALRQTIGN